MESNLLVLMLIGHFVVDYYLQNDRMVKRKKDSLLHQLSHGLIYLVVNCLLVLPLGRLDLYVLAVIITLLHVIIDLSKYGVGTVVEGKSYNKVVRRLRKWQDHGIIYLVDQGLHMMTLLLVVAYYDMAYGQVDQWLYPFGSWQIDNLRLRYLLAVLVILKPVNITFRELFNQNRPSEDKNFTKDLSAGKRIGNMERLMVLIFLILNQYTAIGLVFTAKSVTRYNRISEEPAFAEYYLLGTLFSILATLLVYLATIYL